MSLNKEDIIIKYLSGNMSEGESALFLKEVATDDELSSEFESYKTVWQLTNQLNYDQGAVNASWHTFQHEVKAPYKEKFGFDWLKVAASVTILVAFSVGMWFFGSTDVTFTTTDTKEVVTLSDNTIVELNRNSTLTYDKEFDGEREVTLSGQANFDVSKSSEKFIVHSKSGDITVHGTQFNVYSNSVSGFTLIELYEGSISFKGNTDEIMLVPGQRLIVDENGSTSLSKFTNKSEWLESISCDNVPLSYILGQLKLTYGVGYNLSNKLLKEHYTVSLPKDDLSVCIKILNEVSGKSFALIDGTIVLK
jgi:ferric-dicitrate binding protein FerR (iron transport regulator)